MKKLLFPVFMILSLLSFFGTAIASDFEISANLDDYVKIFSNAVINEPVIGDVVIMFGNAEINSPVTGDVVVIGGNSAVNSPVTGDVVTILGDMKLNSTIAGDAVNVFGTTKLSEKSVVSGDLVTVGQTVNEKGYRVMGEQNHTEIGLFAGFNFTGLFVGINIIWAVLMFIVGTVTSLKSSRWFTNMVYGMTDGMGKKFGVGLLLIIGAVIITPIVSITIVGPLLIIFLLLMSETIICSWVGRLVIRNFIIDSGYISFTQFITGFALVEGIKLVPLLVLANSTGSIFVLYTPVIIVINILIGALGLGSMLLTFKDRNKEPFTP